MGRVQGVLRWVSSVLNPHMRDLLMESPAILAIVTPRRPKAISMPSAPSSKVRCPVARPSEHDRPLRSVAIASLYSPFSLSLLPLSTGSSLPFLRNLLSLSLDQYTLTSSLHCSPADSLEIHRILSAERSLGVHWGTFCDSDEARGTRVEFGRRRRDVGVKGTWEGEGEIGQEGEGKGRFVICDIGESLVIP